MLSNYSGNSNATEPQKSNKPILVAFAGGETFMLTLDLTMPPEFAVSGVPATGPDALIEIAWEDAPANFVLAAPADDEGQPVFRLLVAADIPADLVIDGGTIDDTPIGGDTPAAAAFTTAEITTDAGLVLTGQTDAAGAETGTLETAPTAGDPAIWLRIERNGVTYAFPGWAIP